MYISEYAMRREYRRPLSLCLGVLLQLLASWRVRIMGGGCDASASFLKGRVSVILYLFYVILNFLQK